MGTQEQLDTHSVLATNLTHAHTLHSKTLAVSNSLHLRNGLRVYRFCDNESRHRR